MKTENLMTYENEPFMFLEGGTGMNEDESIVYKKMVANNYECWSIEDLYENPQRLAALQFLKPKTLIFGTTGVYQSDLNLLIDLAGSLDLSSIEKIVLTLGTEKILWRVFKDFKKKYKKLIFYKLNYVDENEAVTITRFEGI